MSSRAAGRGTAEQRAVIDIGSNTVRMVIYGGPPRAPRILFNEKVTARLGRGVVENGKLSGKSSGVAMATLARFVGLIKLQGVRQVDTVATAAVRDAANGGQFLAAVQAIGLEPRLLTGEEEALTSAMGVIGAFPHARGVVADLGGGSLELVHVDGQSCEPGISLPLGSLRLPQLREGGNAKFGQRIHSVVTGAGWSCAAGETLYLVGGSHRAFARFAIHHLDWPLDDPHGFQLSPDQALAICRRILRGKLAPGTAGLSASRLSGLPDTAALLSVLIRETRPAALVFSSWGLREGLLYSALDKASREQDPLLAGVSAFTESMDVPVATGIMVARWTTAANPQDGENREALRLAASMLALASHRIEPNLRAELASQWALRKRWIGASAEDRAMIAACVLASAGRSAALPPTISRLASADSLREAQAWGLAIRLCRRFTAPAAQALANSALRHEGSQLILSAREPYAALFTDTIEKDLHALAARLDLQPSFRLIDRDAHLG